MAYLSTPSHGKYGNVYISRPNNFIGDGLNDLTWGTAWDHTSSEFVEIEIQSITGTVDVFKYRVNGGAWTEDQAITGAAQTIVHDLTITFAATTGHTVGDAWSNGNFASEATTVDGSTAQITDTTKRYLKPDAALTITPTETVNVISIDYTTGTIYFDGAPGVTTVDGNNAYIDEDYLQVLGYIENWSLSVNVAIADATYMQLDWEQKTAGQANGSITIGKFFIAAKTFWEQLGEIVLKNDKMLLQLFMNMPTAQSGTHYLAWGVLSSLGVTTSKSDMVKENVTLTLNGPISPVYDA